MAGIVVAAAVLLDARIAAIDVAVDALVGCGGGRSLPAGCEFDEP